MYQAIVFLPLLGAILGRPDRAGRRARALPGEAPPPGAEDDATDAHAAHHAPHGAWRRRRHPPFASRSVDDHGQGHGEPAAAGSRTAELITTTLLMISMILSWIAFVQVGFGHHDTRVPIFTWIASGDLKIDWALRIDTLTAVMLVVVNTVSALRASLFHRLHGTRTRTGRASSPICRCSPSPC